MFRKLLPFALTVVLLSCSEIRKAGGPPQTKDPASLTEEDLRNMVEGLFVEEDPGGANYLGLLSSGHRAVPYLIRALADPRTQNAGLFNHDVHVANTSPFERICNLLAESAPPEAAGPLLRYMEHPDNYFRRVCARVLAKIGTAECVGPVKRALADNTDEVRDAALAGIRQGIDAQHRDPVFLNGIYPDVLSLLDRGPHEGLHPASVLTAIDPASAARVLEMPRYFNLKNPELGEILTALDSERIAIPRPMVMGLLAELEPLAAQDEDRESQYAAALILYARNPDDKARERFMILIGSSSPTIASAGARGLEILAGISPARAVSRMYGLQGLAAMTKPQQYYHAVVDYQAKVHNGGHRQYFYNSSGDIHETAIEGLRAIGAAGKADILAGAAGAFGSQRPAAETPGRRSQMDHFGPAQERIFQAADERFFHSEEQGGERLTVLLTLYALNHKSDFVAAP